MNKPQYITAAGRFAGKVKAPGNGWLGETDKGNRFVRVPVIVTDEGDQQNREGVWQGYLTDKAQERTLRTLDDVFGKEWTFDALHAGNVDWPGTHVKITVEEEEYNGEVRHKIRWLNPAVKKADVEQDEVTALNNILAAIRGSAPAPATTADDKDDIPF